MSENRIEAFFIRNKGIIKAVVLGLITSFYLYLIVLRTLEGGTVINKVVALFGVLIVLNFLFYDRSQIFIISQLYFVITLAILEALFIINPSIFPSCFSDYSSKIKTADRLRMVEFLKDEPYAKFRPDTVIRSQGKRGQDFIYEWQTDKLGFKNDPAVYEQSIEAVALGDSFTECMGCNIADTWSSILSSRYGINTLNLGVQGYAPQQLTGSLAMYGMQFKPKYVIYGYCGTTFYRTAYFEHYDEKKSIAAFRNVSPIFSAYEIKGRSFDSFTSILIRQSFIMVESLFSNKGAHLVVTPTERNGKLLKYKNWIQQDILLCDKMHFDTGSSEWLLTVDSIREAKKLSDSIGAKLILVYLPHRPYIYYKYLTNRDMPDSYVEVKVIEEFEKVSKELGIAFIRIDEPLFEYMDSLVKSGYDYKDLPYFYKDGHMSPKGTAIVAKTIAEYIKGTN
ncbi:MAG: hypothetical protein PHN63_06040 [Candidatus Omnitrophica bacterium]|nr:hypothetical protein [Candidatus Omnitrophota bacterium]